VFPVFHMLAFAAGAGHRRCARLRTSAPRGVRGLAIGDRTGMRVLLANLTPHPVTVDLTIPRFVWLASR